jgi:prolyl oligopeptidase
MLRLFFSSVAVWFMAAMALFPASAHLATPALPTASAADPYLWLEDVDSPRALAWVRERNATTESQLKQGTEFESMQRELREVLDSRDQIPVVTRLGDSFYNFWRDASQPRGLWRRTTMAEYGKAQPAWETVLDLDALVKAEGVNWVWSGANCLPPLMRRCMLRLSRGGADAVELREFDTVDKRFVEGGFRLPEAKQSADWLNADTLLVSSADSPAHSTESGYARTVRLWPRGTPWNSAKPVFEGKPNDISVWFNIDHTPGFERVLFTRSVAFFSQRFALANGHTPQALASAVPLDVPEHARPSLWRERLVLFPRRDWTVGEQRLTGGTLAVADLAAWQRGERRVTVLFSPSATRVLLSHLATRSHMVLNQMDNVASVLEELTPPTTEGQPWARRWVPAPAPGTLQVSAVHNPHAPNAAQDPWANHYWVTAADFLQPSSLQLARIGGNARETLKQRTSHFDAAGMRIEQRFARSRDGTRVPYFIVMPSGMKTDGNTPTLLYGYGGFQVSQLPFYSGGIGRAWLARGGAFVVANIRGGGEFGPAWHQAALREKRQNSFDDFIAVAEDLVQTGVTRPSRLGIQGGSQGGLLVATVAVQRPDLFGAVLCQVPLLDMQRYHKLLAGASWVAEYGNPDVPEDWAFISRYSPYQRAAALPTGVKLPPMFITTSTRDDRVHPGHARKMVALLAERGQPVSYWENIEGGHGGAADNAQRATMQALGYRFLWRTLGSAE